MAPSKLPARRPRLLVITPDFPPARGGIQLVVQRIAAGVKAFETRVVAPDSPGAARFDRESGVSIRRVSGTERLRGARSAALNAAAVSHALRFRPDVTLSAHLIVSPAAATISRLLGTRTCQYFYAEEIAAKPRLAAFAADHANQSIALSAYTAGLIAGTGARPPSVRLIPPGVDIPGDPQPQVLDRPTFLTIARLEERYKGHDVMIRALPLVLAKVPDAQWIVIGEGSLRPGLEALARSYGVADSISFLGAVPNEQRNAWLRRADLLAMPSRLPAGGFAGEGFGIVYLEANAYGKPVVAGGVGGALDAVLDEQTGLLVDPNDPLAVAEAIVRLLLDRELAGRLGRRGAERASQFAWPLIVERVEAALLDALRAPPSHGGPRAAAPNGSAGAA
jgi:phosphatidylinositol alpha-1,6-mannosyltransferase